MRRRRDILPFALWAVGVVVAIAVLVVWLNGDRVSAASWTLVKSPRATARTDQPPIRDRKRLEISISAGCYEPHEVRLDRVEVDETESTVVITAYVDRPRLGPDDDDCDRAITHVVRLAGPLGDRRLLDGRTEPPSKPGPG